MHSSRMRTGRSLTICCNLLPGEGSPWSGGGVLPGPGGCLVPGGLPVPGGVLLGTWGGVLLGSGGFSLPGGGFCLVQGWVGLPGPRGGGGGSPETPPVNRITDTCKNITLATTSLRPVKTRLFVKIENCQFLVKKITRCM